MERGDFNSYVALEKKSISYVEIINFHLDNVLASIRRKINARATLKSPFRISVLERIPPAVFLEVYKAIKDYKTLFGRVIEVKRDKKNIIKEIKITFDHLGSLKFHLSKLCSVSVSENFHKNLKNGVSGDIVVSGSKLAVMTYKVSTKTMVMEISYKVTNKYGNVCSY